ncbi:MAG UNVERIFIED_CONTAM: hypothetical protein LVQ98_08525 [Rickettsiaceae bacterium]
MHSRYRKFILLVSSLILTSCSTYPAKFKCGDARGLGCTMVREIDYKIDNGEVETAYKQKKRICKNCPKDSSAILEPANDNKSKVTLSEEKREVLDNNIISF